jgi:acyl carrier protein
MEDTFTRVRALMAQELGVAPETIEPSTELAALGIDSLAALEFVFTLEEAFGVRFGEDADIRGGKVEDVVDIVERELARAKELRAAA